MTEFNKGRTIALLAHRAAIEEIAEIQQRMILRAGSVGIGSALLPFAQWRRRIHGTTLFRQAPEASDAEAKADQERLDRLYTVVTELEAAFADIREGDNKAFAEAMADHFRTAARGWKA